jgi:hypothetical protein
VIGPPQVLAEATCCAELIEALRSRKEALGLSNEAIEHLIPLTAGHCDKVIGLSGTRGLSPLTIDGMLSSLGLKLLVAIDPEPVSRMRSRWENAGARDQRQVRPPARISKMLLSRAKPYVIREAARKAASVRWRGISPELRSRLMREVSLARWHACAVASEPAPQQETATQ